MTPSPLRQEWKPVPAVAMSAACVSTDAMDTMRKKENEP